MGFSSVLELPSSVRKIVLRLMLSHILSLLFDLLFFVNENALVSYCKTSALQDGRERVEKAY